MTGWDVTGDELRRTARRIVVAKRLFNLREGWTRSEDRLPERFLSEPLELDSGREATLSPERLDSMIAAYYSVVGSIETACPQRRPRPSSAWTYLCKPLSRARLRAWRSPLLRPLAPSR